jgi:hypothetical protein
MLFMSLVQLNNRIESQYQRQKQSCLWPILSHHKKEISSDEYIGALDKSDSSHY